MTDAEIVGRLRKLWLSKGYPVVAGVSLEGIREFERNRSVTLPLALREYFGQINGTAGSWRDKTEYHFWSLSEVKTMEGLGMSVPGRESMFVFADYSIYGAFLAVRLAPGQSDEVTWTCDQPMVVAASFREFLDFYLTDPLNVLFPSGS